MEDASALRAPGFAPASLSVAGVSAPTLVVAGAVMSWGLGGVLVKLMSIGGLSLAFYRLWFGFLLMLAIVVVARRLPTLADVRRAAPAGVLFGVNVAFFFTAVRLTTVANANLIGALQPAIVLMVAGPLFGEKSGSREAIWTAVSIVGVAIVIVGGAGSPAWNPAGDALAFCAVLTFTGYFLISKHIRTSMGTLEYMVGVQLFAALTITPIALVPSGRIDVLERLDWAYLVIIVFCTGIGAHLLVNWAHRYVDVSVSSLMMLLVPVVAGVAAWLILDESLTAVQIAGSMVTLGAILVIVRGSSGGEDAESHAAAAVDAPV
jgi:drug/metabolite transporter (DMT)-like permease